MWAALETVGALSVLAALLGVTVGVTLWFTSRRAKVLAYFLVAFLLSGAVLIVAARMGDPSDEPGTTTRRELARPESKVLTPADPTPTVQATPTTVPPQVSGACPTHVEDAYFSDMGNIMLDIGDDLAAIERMSNDASGDPDLLFDDYWRSQMDIVLDFLISDADQLESLQPPASVAAIHSDNLGLARTIREFVQVFARGIADHDAETIREAAAKMERLVGMAKANTVSVSTFCR